MHFCKKNIHIYKLESLASICESSSEAWRIEESAKS